MNIYDFDGTIYDGDSTRDFCKFCLRERPFLIFNMIIPVMYGILFVFKLVKREKFKEKFFIAFLSRMNDADLVVQAFWETHTGKIKSWYHKQKKLTDIIISASPEFLLAPICEQLGIQLIASKVDIKTGTLLGANCRGGEKVIMFHKVFGDVSVDEFYTDTASDAPMAALADRAYIVKGDKITQFPFAV